jgi:hypothetical protein
LGKNGQEGRAQQEKQAEKALHAVKKYGYGNKADG